MKLTTLKSILFSITVGIFTASIPCIAAAEEGSYRAVPLWELGGFKEPETAFTFPGHKWIYVSNSNGMGPPGYISRMSKDGKIDNYKWVEGMTRPTGMDEHDGFLYVVDLDRVHKIDMAAGKIVKTYLSETGKGLNDIAIRPGGQMYLSDISSGTLYTNNDEDKLVPWIKSPVIPLPNAMMIGPEYLYVGNMGKDMKSMGPGSFGGIVKVSYEDGSAELVPGTDPLGTWDGLDFFADGMVSSSPATGDVYYFHGGKAELVDNIPGQISDFGIDANQGIMYAPLLKLGKVSAFKFERTR